MNSDIRGALEQINKSWRAFQHKGNPMSKAQVIACLEYGISKGYKSTDQITDEDVDTIIKDIK